MVGYHTLWTSDMGRGYPSGQLTLVDVYPLCHQTLGLGTPCYCDLVHITGYLFKLVHLSPPRYRHLVVVTDRRTVGKRAVRILLECCLAII